MYLPCFNEDDDDDVYFLVKYLKRKDINRF